MPSIKERIRRLSGGAKTKVDESPTGQIIFRGWLNKVGAGILASTLHKRYCVLHLDVSGVPMLSMYEAMDVQTLKGARLPLTGATLSSADEKLQVVTEVEGQQTTAKFKTSTKAEAVEWMSHLEMAAKGERPAGSTVPSSPAALTGKLMKPEDDSPAPKSSPSSARPERPAVRTAPATPAAMPEPTASPVPLGVVTATPSAPPAAPPAKLSHDSHLVELPPALRALCRHGSHIDDLRADHARHGEVLKSTPGRLTPQAATAGMVIPNMVIAPTAPFISGLGVIATRLAKLFPGTDLPHLGALTSTCTQEEVAAHLGSLVDLLERCTEHAHIGQVGARGERCHEHAALECLERLIERLESHGHIRQSGIARLPNMVLHDQLLPPSRHAPSPASPTSDAMVAWMMDDLAKLVNRLEAVAAAAETRDRR